MLNTKTLTRFFLYTTLCILSFTFSFGQEIEWQNTIGGSGDDYLTSIQKAGYNGYIIGGYTTSGISGDKIEPNCSTQIQSTDLWILKIDSLGAIQWQNNIGGFDTELFNYIEQTADGGYICGGASLSNISCDKTENSIGISGEDYWVLKLDSLGNIQWQNTIGGSNQDILLSMHQTADAGYILGGYSNSDISGDKTENATLTGFNDYWIIKIDSLGNTMWQNTIGGNGYDDLVSIQQTIDGGFICGGYSISNISGDKTENSNGLIDYWIVKIDSIGNIQWQNTIGGSAMDIFKSIQQTLDGGYICGGYSNSPISGDKTEDSLGGNDYWIVKIDSTGNIQWQKTIGGTGDEYFASVYQTRDGYYLLAGYSNSLISADKNENSFGLNNPSYDYWILKLDSVGNIIWQNTIGGFNNETWDYISNSINTTDDGGIILGGFSNSNISGDKTENCIGGTDYWIIKLTDQYNLITGKTFLDLNSNSTQDIGEPSLINKTITEQNTGRFAFSEQNGFYSVAVLDSGNFYVSPAPMSYYAAVPVNHSATFTGINQTDSLNDFAFQPIGTFNDLCVTLTPLGAFRPGFNASYMVNYENVGTTTLTPTLKLFQSNTLSYVSSTVTPAIANADSVVWSLPALSPFQSGSLVVTLNVNAAAVIGSNIYSQCIIEPIANDYNVYCNYSGVSSTITGSIDPNDILVNEDTLTTTQLATQPYLDYTIRFQNTGNDTAFTAKIINPIDTNKLELSSIEFVNASHPVNLKWVNYNRNMEFLFENILLPDSNINEPLSHGFVHYRIKPKTSLLAGDSVANKAYIYFDFNAPVATNTAITRIVLTTSVAQSAVGSKQLAVYPNPTKDELTIQLNQLNYPNQPISISIYDVLGKSVLNKQSATANCKLQTVNLPSGIYFVEVSTGKEVYRSKFVKE